MSEERFEQWAIVELMGHVRLAGLVSEEEHFGAKLGRIEIPGPEGQAVTQYFGGGSVYRITPCSEEIARAVAARSAAAPVHAWEMRALPASDPHSPVVTDEDDEPGDYDDSDPFPDEDERIDPGFEM